jgi:hypothetical protein
MALPTRHSQWQETLPFALNNDFYSAPFESQDFPAGFTEAISVLSEFSPVGPDPSGWRHLTIHPSFVRLLASGNGPASLNFESFDLQATDISTGSGISKTKCFIFRISQFTTPGTTRVHNMKIWASDLSDFLTPETNKMLFYVTSTWTSGFSFNINDIGNKLYWMPSSLPESQNLFRTDGARTIHGSNDADVSQYVYVALAASGTTPLGEYGAQGDGPEGFNIRVTFNVDNLERFHD